MKFLLNENTKFILEEKFILNEQFILTEAEENISKDSIEKLKNDINFIINNIKIQINKLDLEDDIQLDTKFVSKIKDLTIDKKIQEFKQTIDTITEFAKKDKNYDSSESEQLLHTEISSLITEVEKIIIDIKESQGIDKNLKEKSAINTAEIETIIKQIKELLAKTDPTLNNPLKKQFNTLVNNLTKLETNIEKLITNLNQTNMVSFKEEEDTEYLQNFGVMLSTINKQSPDHTIFTKQYFDKLADSIASLKATPLGSLDLSDLKRWIKTNDQFIQRISEIIEAVSKNTTITNAENTSEFNSTVGWAERYVKKGDTDSFWDEYFAYLKKDWNLPDSSFNKILKIKDALKAECASFGFDNSNPFFDLLKNIYLNAEYSMSEHHYNIIHNMIASDHISEADLRGKGKLKNLNLIFCKHLYAQAPAIAKELLVKQTDLVDNETKYTFPITATDNTGTKAINNLIDLFYNIFYTSDTIKLNVGAESSMNLVINDLAKINNLKLKFIGKTATLADKQKSLTNSEVMKKIKSTDTAVKVLLGLYLAFPSDSTIGGIINKYQETSTSAAKLKFNEILSILQDLNNTYRLNLMSQTQARELANEIINSNKYKLTKK